jgi:hypothetical protein
MEEKNWAKVNKNTNIVENVEVATEDWVEKWKIENPESENVYILDEKIKATMQGTYDFENKVFIDIQPYNSWVLNKDTFQWESPIPYPEDDKDYYWNEDNLEWVELEELKQWEEVVSD